MGLFAYLSDGKTRVPVTVTEDGYLIATVASIGAVDDVAETDPGEDATLIALTKGQMTKLDTLLDLVGTAADAAGTSTLIGLLKQISANTEPA